MLLMRGAGIIPGILHLVVRHGVLFSEDSGMNRVDTGYETVSYCLELRVMATQSRWCIVVHDVNPAVGDERRG